MKKVRDLLILLLSALMLTVFVACSEPEQEVPVSTGEKMYNALKADWAAANGDIKAMPDEPNYTKLSEADAKAFAEAAKADGHYVSIKSSAFSYETDDAGFFIRQDDEDGWFVDDYRFEPFRDSYKAGKLGKYPRYFFMPEHTLAQFKAGCATEGWEVLKCEFKDFQVKFTDKISAKQDFNGWHFTDTTYSDMFKDFTGANVEVLPTDVLFADMNETQLNTFITATGYSLKIMEDKSVQIQLGVEQVEGFIVTRTLVQTPEKKWVIEEDKVSAGDPIPAPAFPHAKYVYEEEVNLEDPIAFYMIGHLDDNNARFFALRNNGNYTVDLSTYSIRTLSNIANVASETETDPFAGISLEKGGILILVAKDFEYDNKGTAVKPYDELGFNQIVVSEGTIKYGAKKVSSLPEYTGNDSIYLVKNGEVIDSIDPEHKIDGYENNYMLFKTPGKNEFKDIDGKVVTGDKKKNIAGCAQKKKIYVRDFSADGKTALRWNNNFGDVKEVRSWINNLVNPTTYVYVDLNTFGDTFQSRGTYISVLLDGKKVATTKDRFTQEGAGISTELIVDGLVANNKGSEGANEHQYGFTVEKISNSVIKITSEQPIEASKWSLVGLGGHMYPDDGRSPEYEVLRQDPTTV